MAHGTKQATSWVYQLGLSSEIQFRHEEHRDSGMTHGDDFVVTGPSDGLVADIKNKIAGVYPIKTKIISTECCIGE